MGILGRKKAEQREEWRNSYKEKYHGSYGLQTNASRGCGWKSVRRPGVNMGITLNWLLNKHLVMISIGISHDDRNKQAACNRQQMI
jgi:hypothetical protein